MRRLSWVLQANQKCMVAWRPKQGLGRTFTSPSPPCSELNRPLYHPQLPYRSLLSLSFSPAIQATMLPHTAMSSKSLSPPPPVTEKEADTFASTNNSS
eukprot:IDg14266t1